MVRIALLAAVISLASGLAVAAEREVQIDGGRAPLYGSLLAPDAARPGPAVLIVAGSGPTDRDGNSTAPGVRPANLKLIADGLAARGFASLRFDKRGIGRSAGAATAEADLRFAHYVDDAAAWTRFLRAQPGVTCVVILGHSEGALIAALAAQKVETCGVISASGIGRALDIVLMEQLRAQNPPANLMGQIAGIVSELKAGRTVPGIPATDPLFRPSVQPYLISQIGVDPPAALAAVKAPVLILQGDNDLQVGVEDARRLAAARSDARLVILPANHVLKTAPSDRAGNIATYADPALPLAPGVIEAIGEFVSRAGEPTAARP